MATLLAMRMGLACLPWLPISAMIWPKRHNAFSIASDHGLPQLKRMQFRYFCFGEKIGPGAMPILSARARWNNSSESTHGGSSTHNT